MEKKELTVCCVVGLLGLLSASAGFAAEATRIKVPMVTEFLLRSSLLILLFETGSEVQFVTPTQCKYPRSPALPLGLTAGVALMVAQVIINVSSGCSSCVRNPRYSISSSNKWRQAMALFFVSWFSFTMGFMLLLTGAALNDEHGEESMYFGSYYCYVVKPGVFAGGAVLSLVSVSFGIMYYLLKLTQAKNTLNGPSGSQGQGGVAMQGQSPPQDHPVFVHEDTYMRRQFT